MTKFVKKFIGMFEKLKKARKDQGLRLRELSSLSSIDQTLLSRIERGERMPTEAQLNTLIEVLKLNPSEVKKEWLAEKVFNIVRYYPEASEILKVAESRIEYLVKNDELKAPDVSEKTNKLLQEADALKAKWHASQPLNISQLKRLNEYFDVEYTYESNRIEGNTLTLNETKLVMHDGLTIGGKSFNEHLEVVNHAEAIGFMRDLVLNKEHISRRVILELHRLILKEIDTSNAGAYRKVPVKISGSRHEPPQPFLLEKLMDDLFQYYFMHEHSLHPVILAAEMHERLVSIHPFIDGNGRTARLFMNLILMRNGYTRVNIKGSTENRLNYYKALESVQVHNDPEPFYQLVASEAKLSLEEHLEWV